MMINYPRLSFYLLKLMRSARWDPKKLLEYQNKKLREIVKYAYENVPFYRKKLKSLGLVPSDIATKEDLKKIPPLGKDEIRNNLNKMVSKEFNVQNLKMCSTSGSTGKPLFLYVSAAEDEFKKAKHLRANISCGQKPRDKWVVITAPHHFGSSSRLQRIFRIYAPTPISVFENMSRQISKIEKIEPDILDGYSSSLLLLAKGVERLGSRKIKPRFIIGGAELIDDFSRKYVEKTFSVPFYDQYSCVEFERLSWQCKERVGYHIDADNTILQFMDKNGEEVSSGERGEIVCTSLYNYAMPLIRYSVGDIGIPSDEKCQCNITLPLMKMVEGRSDSLLVFSNNNVLSPRTFTIAVSSFKFYKHIDLFRIVQKKIDLLEISVKMKEGIVDKDVFEQALVEHLRRMVGLSANLVAFEVKFVKDIPLDKSGKLMIVISELS